jgi:hypothetical protein
LQGQVRVSRADGSVVEQPFDVVDHDAGHRRTVGVVEDLANGRTLGGFCEPDLKIMNNLFCYGILLICFNYKSKFELKSRNFDQNLSYPND